MKFNINGAYKVDGKYGVLLSVSNNNYILKNRA